MEYRWLFLKSLALTSVIEIPVLFAFFRLLIKSKSISSIDLLITGFLMSLTTLPYLWFIFPGLIENNTCHIIAAESFAVVIESLVIWIMLKPKYSISFLAAFACNMISFLIGVLFSWP